ncbi:hypothetical protein WICPIJ_002527 [Wickerhamomyces pijperi]|uniref:STI1 domain-containing protein n=2 Tax=Saccharomycotina TaxID=147537 RepID=A0A9P8Q9G2_WICPI|nr:hypothetical protein WICPIJ_002527 [Wickerhamomyces pijperi]
MSADEYKAQGNAAFVAKDFTKAVEFFTKAIEASPSANHALYSNRSGAYTSLKQFDKALEDALKTIEINPTWAKGYNRAGAAYYGLGEFLKSKEYYEKTLEIDPSNAQAKSEISKIEQYVGNSAEQEQANDLFKIFNDPNLIEKLKRNPQTAELMKDPALVDKVIRFKSNPQAFSQEFLQDPRLMTVFAALMGINLNDDSPVAPGASSSAAPEPATATPATSTSSEPAAEPTKDTEGDVEVKDAEPEVTEDASSKALADESKAEGNKLYKQRQFDAAIELYNKAYSIYPDVTYLNNRAAAEFEKGDYETTIATCEDAIAKGREIRTDYKVIAKSYARIGSSYLKLENYEQAIKFFEKSLTEHRTPDVLTKLRSTQKLIKEAEAKSYIDPAKAEEARLQGRDFFTKGDWPSAVKAYDEMIKRAPEDARGYSNRAAALAKLMSFPEAVKDAETAIKIDPTFIRAYIRKASAEIAMKSFSEALETLDIARTKDTELNNGANAKEIDSLYSKAYSQRFSTDNANETPEETLARVSRDPEVAAILQDPIMNSILGQARDDPRALQEHMKNPEIAKKVNILIAAGVIRTR